MADVIIIGSIILLVAGVLVYKRRAKKNGKSSCGCSSGCSSCSTTSCKH